jgi:UDP-N-acetylmuramate dehydrogenase
VGETSTATVREQVLLARYTTLGLGGPAARFIEAGSDADVVAAVREADGSGEPVLVLGGGSNLVVADEGFPGTVVRVATTGVRISSASGGRATVTVAAGEDWDPLVERFVAEGLSGVECLSGIPGLAGATPIQNVGAYGQEVAETIVAVRAYDRLLDAVVELSGADCGFGYRTSAFKRRGTGPGPGAADPGAASPPAAGQRPAADRRQPAGVERPAARRRPAISRRAATEPAAATGRYVVLGVTFRLARDPLSAPVRYPELARTLSIAEGERVPVGSARSAVLSLRRRKGMVLDPADPDTRSAGSFFTNPVLDLRQFAEVRRRAALRSGGPPEDVSVPHFPAGDGRVKVPAAWLIEQAGFGKGYPGNGGARISSKHTLALVNPGGASAASLIGLARQIRDGVRHAFAVELVTEPVLVGAEL